MTQNGHDRVRKIALTQLAISGDNVRRREITADIDQLAQSLQQFGLQQPIKIIRKGDKFEIIIGQRRYLAAKQLGWEAIDAIVEEKVLPELQAKAMSFSENVQRVDLDPRDKADMCQYFLAQLGSVAGVANYIGTTEQTVRKWLAYAAVPEPMKQLVADKKLSRPVATRIAQVVPDRDMAVAIAERIATMKPSPDLRDRIMAELEASPRSPVDTIVRRAQERKVQKVITFILPERWNQALERAVKALGTDEPDIAKDALVEWLENHRYANA